MKPAEDFGAWLTKPEALSLLGKSERTLDRLVTAGRVHRIARQRDGRPPQPMYNRADLEQATASEAFEVRPQEKPGQLALHAPAAPQQQPAEQKAPDIVVKLTIPIPETETATAKAQQPWWLSLQLASERCGLSARLLRKLIRAGRLPALQDGPTWKIHEEDLASISATRANGTHVTPMARKQPKTRAAGEPIP